jgi:hypothetical protein
MEAIQSIQDRHVERGGDGAFLLVTADVNVAVIGSPIGKPMDQPGVGMEGEDDRLVRS